MQPQVSAPRDGLVVAHGYGIKIYVDRGHLIVHDGICDERETRRFNRVTSKLKRVLVLGHTGMVTLEALRWIRDVGAVFAQIDRDGSVVATSVAMAPSEPALRRAQALAAFNDHGLEIARSVLLRKVAGQATIQAQLDPPEWAALALTTALRDVERAGDLDALLAAESAAASAYWQAWSAVPVWFAPKDRGRVPEHWRAFGQRHSPLSSSPRSATNPANAILNLLYALLEIETVAAIQAVSLDPGLGVFHLDRRGRESLALDLMEACRPTVDAYLLRLLRERVFTKADFAENHRGACRLNASLAAPLAHTMGSWRREVGPVAEATRALLASASDSKTASPTPLTQARRSAAWAGRRSRNPRATTAPLPATCRACGVPLPHARRRECESCRDDRLNAVAIKGRQAAAAALGQMRSQDQDPAHGGRAAHARGRKNAAHQTAVRAWDGERPGPAVFEREILPGLRARRIADLVAATGLSEHYCSLIRLGKKTPHPRHWPAFAALARPA